MIKRDFNVIYGLVDPNTKELRYVGYAKDMYKRFNQHHRLCSLKSNTYKNNWIKSLLSKGQKAELIIMEKYDNSEKLPQAEIDMIAYFRFIGCDLVNGTLGGDGSLGVKNFLGKHHTSDSKNQISKSNIGQKRSVETKQNISKSKIGKKLSQDTKNSISQSNMGNKNAIGNKNWIGKNHSEESKNKVSKANKGRYKGKSWSIIDGKRVWNI